jgi:hypothetical protein
LIVKWYLIATLIALSLSSVVLFEITRRAKKLEIINGHDKQDLDRVPDTERGA